MDAQIVGLIKEIPSLILMFFLVKMFLHAMEKRDAAFLTAINKLNQENLEAREKSRVTIEENSVRTAQCTLAMGNMTNALQRLTDRLQIPLTNDQQPHTG